MIVQARYKQISSDIFILMFIRDGLIFWRQKMAVVNRKIQKIKQTKRITKNFKNGKTTISAVTLFIVLCKLFLLL